MKIIIKLLLLLLTITGCEKEIMYPPCKPTQYTDEPNSCENPYIRWYLGSKME